MFSANPLQARAALMRRARELQNRRRTALAFSIALGLTLVGGVTVLADIRQVLAFADESAASFFRADRERIRPPQAAQPARAHAAAPQTQANQTSSASIFRALTIPVGGNETPKKRDERRDVRPLDAGKTTRPEPLAARSVCVRLCDGYHFPVAHHPNGSDIAGQEAVCASACPDSPTRLYILPAGAEDITAAYSARDRKSYAALPVALRHTNTRDNTCACRRDVSHAARLSHLTDKTLRPGDAVMTQKGFRFLRGARKFPYRETDFAGLEAAALSRGERLRLQAMERASLPQSVRKEAPLSPPRSTQSPIPALGPFSVRRTHERAGVEPQGASAGLGG